MDHVSVLSRVESAKMDLVLQLLSTENPKMYLVLVLSRVDSSKMDRVLGISTME